MRSTYFCAVFCTVFYLISAFPHLSLSQNVDTKAAEAWQEAIFKEDLKQMQRFLDEGVDINTRNEEGETPLMIAITYEMEDAVAFLLARKADMNTEDIHGRTPFLLAIEEQNKSIIQAFLDHGVDIHAECTKGYTPIMIAAVVLDVELVQLFLSHKVNLDVREHELGWTALRLALLSYPRYPEKAKEVIELLLNNNADVNSQDLDGATILMNASYMTYTELVALFLKHNADTNLQTVDGTTALMLAADSIRNDDIVRLLLDHNADMHIKNDKGQTALTIAMEHNAHKIADLLRAHQSMEETHK